LTLRTNAGTWSTEPISRSLRMTASLAPPCSSPYNAAMSVIARRQAAVLTKAGL
jgi:hypothetical protein